MTVHSLRPVRLLPTDYGAALMSNHLPGAVAYAVIAAMVTALALIAARASHPAAAQSVAAAVAAGVLWPIAVIALVQFGILAGVRFLILRSATDQLEPAAWSAAG